MICSTFKPCASLKFIESGLGAPTVICVLSIIREKLENGQHMTQREIFYRLIEIPQFRSIEQATVNNCIRDICSILQIPRICLGILAAHRGQICGLIRMKVCGSCVFIAFWKFLVP